MQINQSQIMKKSFLALLTAVAFTACQPQGKDPSTETVPSETSVDNTEVEVNTLNTDSIATAQMGKRQAIENQKETLTRKDLKTDSLREQVAQKWSLLHFYFKEEQLVRVKTYPHGTVSTRTEEFYFENGDLIAAVIEDDGLAETAAGEEIADDKAYYFYNGELIKEVNNTTEDETYTKESDAARLLQEAKEYQELANTL
jgi:hypothetical protein